MFNNLMLKIDPEYPLANLACVVILQKYIKEHIKASTKSCVTGREDICYQKLPPSGKVVSLQGDRFHLHTDTNTDITTVCKKLR